MANTRRILANVPATLSVTLVDSDGQAREVQGAVTASVTRGNGESLIGSRTAVEGLNAGEMTIGLTAAETAVLDHLSVTWTEDGGGIYVTTVDVVGGFYFSLDEVRRASPGLTDTNRYPTPMLIDVRAEVEEEAERITGRAFVPRYRRIELDGRSGFDIHQGLRIPAIDVRKLRSLSAGGRVIPASVGPSGELFPLTPEQVANAGSFFDYSYGLVPIVVEYEYGTDAPPPDMKRAALMRMVSRLDLAKTGVPNRNEFQVIDGKFFTVTQPGVRGSLTGIREVDAVYQAYAVSGDLVAVPIR
jgi:hypothetical protein